MISSVPALALIWPVPFSIRSGRFGRNGDYAVIIQTQLTACDESVDGHFFIPIPILVTILDVLGVKEGCQNRSGWNVRNRSGESIECSRMLEV